ncbi:MAG: dihydroorotate dehydrogenase, partial [Spirochaetales bacterium]|nr:dihydroorotate dehydrogenase [Spirochaetales bacterium]
MSDVIRRLMKKNEVLLGTVSGVGSTKAELIRYFDESVQAIDLITTKSFQNEPNPGNREPIICEVEKGTFGNSVGLRNPGLQVALHELRQLRKTHSFRALLNVSLSASTPEDFVTLIKAFDEVADLVELNFSCPHAEPGYGSTIGENLELAAFYVRYIREHTGGCRAPLFVKLTPNVEDIASIAKAVVEAGADGIVAINTVGPLVHIDPVAQKPILQNKLGGKGGQSGKAVFPIALKAIQEIRETLGEAIPIIGMGGVDSGADVAKLIEAGANVVGIGSALGTVDQRSWPRYLEAVKEEASHLLYNGKKPGISSASFIKTHRQMEYRKHIVLENEPYGGDTVILRLDGRLPAKAGQFAFLWLPQIGEKPFSVAHNDPLTFIIKRRGPFSDALCSLKKGDEVYIRGLYGEEFDPPDTKKALLIGGGTGVAVLPALAEQLSKRGTEVEILVGTSEAVEGTALLEEKLSSYGSFICVADEGKPARVLDLLDGRVFDEETACYLVGPRVFMALAAQAVLERGVREDLLHLSQELMTLCGIGMCGE